MIARTGEPLGFFTAVLPAIKCFFLLYRWWYEFMHVYVMLDDDLYVILDDLYVILDDLYVILDDLYVILDDL